MCGGGEGRIHCGRCILKGGHKEGRMGKHLRVSAHDVLFLIGERKVIVQRRGYEAIVTISFTPNLQRKKNKDKGIS